MFSGVEVPDFREIPKDRWEEVMRTIPERLRLPSVQGIGIDPLSDAAALVELALSDLPPAPSDRARAAARRSPKLAPQPTAKRFRRADRQVNFRLTDSEFLDLATAAEVMGTTPTQLAGQLVRNGVRLIIAEIDGRPDG